MVKSKRLKNGILINVSSRRAAYKLAKYPSILQKSAIVFAQPNNNDQRRGTRRRNVVFAAAYNATPAII